MPDVTVAAMTTISDGRTRHDSSGHKSERPVMRLLDLLGRRWVLRIIWELRDAPLTWRELRAACDDVSPSVLQQRLNDLRKERIVHRAPDGYALTERGRELLALLLPVNEWAKRWNADDRSTEPT
jgi:DNA-binding HxlR family transcriptional regulator